MGGGGGGGVVYSKPLGSDPVCESALVTLTLCDPTVPGGTTQVIVVLLTTAGAVHAAPPIETDAPARNPEPVTVIVPPPVVGLVPGLTDDTVGAGLMNDDMMGWPEVCPTATYWGPAVTALHRAVLPLD